MATPALQRYKGTIMSYKNGMGIIIREDDGKKIFFLRSSHRKGYASFEVGETVEFSTTTVFTLFGREEKAVDIASLTYSPVSPNSK